MLLIDLFLCNHFLVLLYSTISLYKDGGKQTICVLMRIFTLYLMYISCFYYTGLMCEIYHIKENQEIMERKSKCRLHRMHRIISKVGPQVCTSLLIPCLWIFTRNWLFFSSPRKCSMHLVTFWDDDIYYLLIIVALHSTETVERVTVPSCPVWAGYPTVCRADGWRLGLLCWRAMWRTNFFFF